MTTIPAKLVPNGTWHQGVDKNHYRLHTGNPSHSAPLAFVYTNEYIATKIKRWAAQVSWGCVDYVDTLEEAIRIAEVKIMTGAY